MLVAGAGDDLAEECAVGAEERHGREDGGGVSHTHVVHLASGSCVCVETSIDSVGARESRLWQVILVVHWEVHSSFTKGERKSKVIVRTIHLP